MTQGSSNRWQVCPKTKVWIILDNLVPLSKDQINWNEQGPLYRKILSYCSFYTRFYLYSKADVWFSFNYFEINNIYYRILCITTKSLQDTFYFSLSSRLKITGEQFLELLSPLDSNTSLQNKHESRRLDKNLSAQIRNLISSKLIRKPNTTVK